MFNVWHSCCCVVSVLTGWLDFCCILMVADDALLADGILSNGLDMGVGVSTKTTPTATCAKRLMPNRKQHSTRKASTPFATRSQFQVATNSKVVPGDWRVFCHRMPMWNVATIMDAISRIDAAIEKNNIPTPHCNEHNSCAGIFAGVALKRAPTESDSIAPLMPMMSLSVDSARSRDWDWNSLKSFTASSGSGFFGGDAFFILGGI